MHSLSLVCFVGTEFVRPVVGYFCNLCQQIFAEEDEAKQQHCSSLSHYSKYQVEGKKVLMLSFYFSAEFKLSPCLVWFFRRRLGGIRGRAEHLQRNWLPSDFINWLYQSWNGTEILNMIWFLSVLHWTLSFCTKILFFKKLLLKNPKMYKYLSFMSCRTATVCLRKGEMWL